MNSKDILNSDHIEKKMNENRLFSIEFIRVINLIEILLFLFIVLDRIRLIIAIKNIDIELRGLMNLISYESGWTFVIITGMLASNLNQIGRDLKSYHWLFKFSGYLCLLHLIGMDFWYYTTIIFVMIFYYSFNQVTRKFSVIGLKKIGYIIIALIIAIIFSNLEMNCTMLVY